MTTGEEVAILPLVPGIFGVAYFAYEVERRRNRLRAVFNTFDDQDGRIASILEKMVEEGKLIPHSSL